MFKALKFAIEIMVFNGGNFTDLDTDIGICGNQKIPFLSVMTVYSDTS